MTIVTKNSTVRQARGTTVTADVPSPDSAWKQAREENARRVAAPSDEFANFVAFATKLVAVPKREIDGQRSAERATKDPRVQASLASAAAAFDAPQDDPQGLQDRIDRLHPR